jgi:hypothetical protein
MLFLIRVTIHCAVSIDALGSLCESPVNLLLAKVKAQAHVVLGWKGDTLPVVSERHFKLGIQYENFCMLCAALKQLCADPEARLAAPDTRNCISQRKLHLPFDY